jgi:hypothetical protein
MYSLLVLYCILRIQTIFARTQIQIFKVIRSGNKQCCQGEAAKEQQIFRGSLNRKAMQLW